MFELGSVTQPRDHSKNRSKGGRISPISYLDNTFFWPAFFYAYEKLEKPFEEIPSLHFVNNFTPRMALATLGFTPKMARAIAIFGEIFFFPC